MRIGVVSDIHANLVALEAVLAEMGEVDALWVCGDTVGYGPEPSDVLALLVGRKATMVTGNHDRVGDVAFFQGAHRQLLVVRIVFDEQDEFVRVGAHRLPPRRKNRR